jgi:hypothetical protein
LTKGNGNGNSNSIVSFPSPAASSLLTAHMAILGTDRSRLMFFLVASQSKYCLATANCQLPTTTKILFFWALVRFVDCGLHYRENGFLAWIKPHVGLTLKGKGSALSFLLAATLRVNAVGSSCL